MQQQDNQVFSFTPPTQIDRQKIIEVKLDPHNYRNTSKIVHEPLTFNNSKECTTVITAGTKLLPSFQ